MQCLGYSSPTKGATETLRMEIAGCHLPARVLDWFLKKVRAEGLEVILRVLGLDEYDKIHDILGRASL